MIISCTHALVFNQIVICPHTVQYPAETYMGFISVGLTFTQWPQGSLKEKLVIPALRLSKESRYVIRVGNMMAGSFHSLMDLSD